MIENIITYLNGRLELLNFFQVTYPLCEKFDDNNRQPAPRYYCGNGEWKSVSDFDFFQGSCYWRKTGRYTVTESDIRSLNASKRLVTFSLPLRLVACVPKSKLSYDDAYAESRVGLTLVKALTAKANDLAKAVQAKRISFDVSSIETDRRSILDEEYSPDVNVRFEFALVAIDLTVMIDTYEDCIQGDCYDYTDECSFLQNLVSADKLLDCLLPGVDFSTQRAREALTAQQESDLSAFLCTNTIVNENYFPAGATSLSYFVSANSAGAYIAETLSNVATVTYTVNTIPVTLPFALAVGDVFEISITATVGGQPSTVTINGTF